MPTPARTSLEQIVAAGRTLIEAGGPEQLTMSDVAAAVGVRAPSLYKHVAGRDELIKLVAEDVVADLTASLGSAAAGADANRDLVEIASAFRRFAKANPGAYRLVFSPLPEAWRPDPARLEMAADAVLRTAAALGGRDTGLETARTLTAWAHGFVSMELAGAFRLGGDVDEAFRFGAQHLAEALAAT
jgi:AcrR family transcriptional regulator